MKDFFVICDFNPGSFVRMLNSNSSDDYNFIGSEYNQVYQSLSSDEDFHAAIVWTRPEMVIPSFSQAINLKHMNIEDCMEEVDGFADSIIKMSKNVSYIFTASWTYNLEDQIYGMLDWDVDLGFKNILSRMNLRLVDSLKHSKNIYVIDSGKWFFKVENPYSPKMWYAAKVPYSNKLFSESTKDIISSIKGVEGLSKKLIVLDLDNTLWGGVVGENGWEGITLGGHDFKGEAFVDFQRNLKRFSLRGIQLAIISKNDESVALDAIKNHPEMVLNIEDFIGWRINWNDKAENLLDLVKEINIGLDSVVFLDDNPAERDRVRNAFTEVLVPDLPEDATLYSSLLNSLDCFNTSSITEEDKNRTAMYVSQIQRNKSISVNSSKKEWLQNLDTSLKVEKINKVNINRITQLFNKTNQLNLSTRRLAQSEILDFASKKNNEIISITLSDSFGQMGLVGIIGIQIDSNNGIIKDFILSCRAMGRGVEKAMLYIAGLELKKMGADVIYAEYIKTERNGPTLKVLEDINLIKKSNIFYMPDNIENLRENHIELDSNL